MAEAGAGRGGAGLAFRGMDQKLGRTENNIERRRDGFDLRCWKNLSVTVENYHLKHCGNLLDCFTACTNNTADEKRLLSHATKHFYLIYLFAVDKEREEIMVLFDRVKPIFECKHASHF